MRGSKLAVCVAALGLALITPGVAAACLPPLPMTADQREASDRAIQETLWRGADQVFTASVVSVELEASSREVGPNGVPMPPRPGEESIRVALRPLLTIKGEAATPETFEFRNIHVGCAPQGLQRAHVGEVYVVYAANPATNTAATAVPFVEIRDPVTRAAWEAVGS